MAKTVEYKKLLEEKFMVEENQQLKDLIELSYKVCSNK